MTKDEIITRKIRKELELQEKRQTDIDASMRRVIELRKSLVSYYPNFIKKSISSFPNEFQSIENFPTTEVIRSYLQYGNPNICDDILLYEYGWFDIKELAAIIKVLYSLKKQQEYKLITLANFEDVYYGPEDVDKRTTPYVNFLIGPNKRMKYLEKYNGTYLDISYINNSILDDFNKERHLNLVRIKQKGMLVNSSLERRYVSYYYQFNDEDIMNSGLSFSSRYNIFDKYFGDVIRRLNSEHRRNIGGLLSFSIDIQDNFIAKVLMSIVIYKKKVNKKNLDNEDYKYIFYELFRENIDLDSIIEREIPKSLVKAR